MQKSILNTFSTIFAAMLSAALLTGCSTTFQPSAIQTDQTEIGEIQGTVHGGQSPLQGAQIYLYAAGTQGYGTSATSLIKAAANTYKDSNGNYYVTTDASGNFSLGGDYTCTAGTQVYAVAVGGYPGGVGNNPDIVQMAGLGQCPAAGNLAAQVPYLVINEVTTVGFAYAMGGFGSNALNISSDAGVATNANAAAAATGIANAMNNANNIINLQYGQVPLAANGNPNSTVPQSKIYTLANILAACVNSSGASSTQCTTLLADAVDTSGNAATDESSAIFNIVHNPTSNVTALFKLQPTQQAFSPYLNAAPTDWTVQVVYTNAISKYGTNGTTIDSGPFNIAADVNGNIWVGDEARGVVEIGPQGAVSTYDTNANGTAFGQIKGVAVSPSGSIWAADAKNNQISILNSTGTATFTTATGAVGITGPAGIAFDTTGNAWVANDSSTSTSLFTPTGANGGTKAYSFGANMSGPAWIAVDSNNNVFAPSQNSAYLGSLVEGNTAGSESDISAGYALAIDASNNVWMPSSGSTGGPWYLYEISCPVTTNKNGKKSITCATATSVSNLGGMNIPDRIALDGGGTLWIANQGASEVSAYNVSTKKWLATAGFTTGDTGDALDAVPDGSGNVWVANSDGTVSQILGIATPTLMPMVPGTYQTKP